jgi:pimeloyl-ACP methyl ester carboxylesterase
MESHYQEMKDDQERQLTGQPVLPPKQQAKVRPKYKKKSKFSSIMGAITHSLQWVRGKSFDTVLVNPHYKIDPENPKPAIHLYCIHGTADRSYAFHTMATRLLTNLPKDATRNMLPDNIAAIHLLAFDGRGRGNDIAFYADQLKSKIIKNGHKDVVIFGHSRGGIVGAQFTEKLAKDAGVNVHGVVTYCPPFDGSPWAVRPFTDFWASVKDMKKGSEFSKQLRPAVARTNTESKKYFYFGVEKDSVVHADSTYILTEGNAHSVTLLPGHGHLSILRSQAVCGYSSDILHEILSRPIAVNRLNASAVDAYREVDAEIIAFKNRPHLGSIKDKLRVLTGLRDSLKALHEGQSGDFSPLATTVRECIEEYFAAVDPLTNKTRRQILQQTLNKPISFFQCAPPKSQQFIDTLIESYTHVMLPPRINSVAPAENSAGIPAAHNMLSLR